MVVMKGIVNAHHLVVKTRTLASLNLVHVAAGVMVGCEGHYRLLVLGGPPPWIVEYCSVLNDRLLEMGRFICCLLRYCQG